MSGGAISAAYWMIIWNKKHRKIKSESVSIPEAGQTSEQQRKVGEAVMTMDRRQHRITNNNVNKSHE